MSSEKAAADPAPLAVTPAMGGPPPIAKPAPAPDLSGEPFDTPPPDLPLYESPPLETPVPPEVIAPIATATSPPSLVAATGTIPSMIDPAAPRPMIIPVAGIGRGAMHDTFDEARGNRRHDAIDILAPRGTPVIAAGDGVVKKLFTSVPGGLTVYEFDPDQRFCYYYAHLDGYAPGLHEGQLLRSGEVLGYVGTTGNAPKNTPHLHFALIRLDAERRWWKGTYVNPYPLLSGR
jgi:murein DD-endopeptidase MepM/ murein hydrolase activator NlpD